MSTKRASKNVPPPTVKTSSYDIPTDKTSDIFQNEEDIGDGRPSLERTLSRTSMLLLEYRQFKAARTIQTRLRGWLVRRIMARKRCAAIIIQREWRGYAARRYHYKLLEQTVQERIEKHYQDSATKIQAMWRGFWVREHIHNQYRMKRSQRMAAEDLMHCIAYKLHYLLRTYQIPGIYSLRNSHALSKVEKLLVSISFKQGNRRSFVTRMKREADMQAPKKYFEQSKHATVVPYTGPNFSGVCDPKCCEVYKEPNIDARMHQVLRMYEQQQYKENQKCPKRPETPPKVRSPKDPEDFCSDVVKSMRRWKIVAPNKFKIRPDVFKNPENVANFLTEIESMYDFMTGQCDCRVDINKRDVCGDGINLEKLRNEVCGDGKDKKGSIRKVKKEICEDGKNIKGPAMKTKPKERVK